MNYFSEDSSHATGKFAKDETTPQDRMTHKRWTQAVVSFYACLFLLMGTVIGAHQIGHVSSGSQQLASLRTQIQVGH